MSSTVSPKTSPVPGSVPLSGSQPNSRDPHEAPPPRSNKKSALRRFAAPIILAGVAIVATAFWFFLLRTATAEPYNGPKWTAKKEKLQLSIVERGTLESAENSDIICRVKASSKGSTVATTIKWIIDDGTQVVRGQKLIELDDSGLQDQLKDQNNKVNDARAKYIQAEENYLIQLSQNFSDIETAKINLVLAELDLKKFLGESVAAKVLLIPDRIALLKFLGNNLEAQLRKEISQSKDSSMSEVLQILDEIGGRIEIARSDREQWLDRASWSQRMVKKGYLSRSQADSDKARLDSSEIALKKVQGELDIYRQFMVERNVTDLWGKIKEAERALDRTKTQAKSKEVQAEADRDGKRAIFLQDESRRLEIEDEIRQCEIFSPQDGMVVYYVPETSRFSSSTQQGVVAQGEPVREGQKLMRIPNLSRMLVNTRVHEAMVSRLKPEVTRPTGFSESLQVAMTVGMPAIQSAASQLAYAVELRDRFRSKDVVVMYPGQKTFVRIDAYPSKVYQGHVKSVATVASAADFLTSDVKVYQTMVSIDGYVENLKPGMSAEVTIIASETEEPVLTIPIQSVLGSIAMGANRKTFVLDDKNQPKLVDITVGRSNDKMVEVVKGLNEGDQVVLSPRTLLGDKSDLRPGTPGKQRGVEVEEIRTKKGGKKSPSPPAFTQPNGPAPAIDTTKKGIRPEAPPKQSPV